MNQLAQAIRKTPVNLIIVRHGNTDLNDQNLVRGWHNVPLNQEGMQQAVELGKTLKNKDLDLIATSDLSRASDTANIISHFSGVPVKIMPELRPWHVGIHTGQESGQVSPKLAQYAETAPQQPVEGGEAFDQFRHRFLTGVQSLIQSYPESNIALVTHHRGEMLMKGWEKEGMPQDHSVNISTFLDWEKGIKPGTYREIPQQALSQAIKSQNMAQM